MRLVSGLNGKMRGVAAATRFLGIYLDDHVALLVGGCELVQRTLRATTEPAAVRSFLERLLPELRDDRAAAARAARAAGRSPSKLKQRLAWIAEKAGRAKLNGSVTSRSPLSLLVELEGVAAVLGISAARWRTLERVGPEELRGDAARRASRAGERLAELEELRLGVVESVLAVRTP
jgi:hypothetical protein